MHLNNSPTDPYCPKQSIKDPQQSNSGRLLDLQSYLQDPEPEGNLLNLFLLFSIFFTVQSAFKHSGFGSDSIIQQHLQPVSSSSLRRLRPIRVHSFSAIPSVSFLQISYLDQN
ncbi:hypothetical protein AMECASPLE_038175, partial [Ameca splendens]